MKDSNLNIQWLDPKSLTPYARNAKIHSTEQIDRIAGQIHAVGWTQPIVVDKDKVIIAGHGRREAAIRLNLDKVPVFIAEHLTEYEAMAARIADNKVSGNEYDNEMLKFDIGTLQLHEVDLKLTGMDEIELKDFTKELSEEIKSEVIGSKEFSEEDFSNFDHRCPKCGFGFNE
jgi:ParB-like chromosome segregation protein Spo0J